jgi:hypothetical protein
MKLAYLHLLAPPTALAALLVSSGDAMQASALIWLSLSAAFLCLPHIGFIWLLTASKITQTHLHLSLFGLDVLLAYWVVNLIQSTSSGNAWLPYLVASMLLLAASMAIHMVTSRIKLRNLKS